MINKNIFLVITKKDWNGIKDEKLKYFLGSLKNLIFRGEVHEKHIEGGLPEKGAWIVCRFNRGHGKKERVVFLRGMGGGDWYSIPHYGSYHWILTHSKSRNAKIIIMICTDEMIKVSFQNLIDSFIFFFQHARNINMKISMI